jgi:hypothetical protein
MSYDELAGPSPSEVHGEIAPADVRPGDPVAAAVVVRGVAEPIPARVWALSPLGVQLVCPPALQSLPAGEAVGVTLRMGGEESRLRGVALERAEDRGQALLGVRWCEPDRPAQGEARGARRWLCSADYLPSGVFANPVRYSDFVHFRVCDISRDGMQLLTSLRNKFLVPGLRFEAVCTFPMVGQLTLAFEVVHARVVEHGGKQHLGVGVRTRARDRRASELIGQYLLQFGAEVTPEALRAQGFRVRSSTPAFDFGWVRTEDEYRQVLELRRRTFVDAGLVGPQTRAEELGDASDARSRILIAKHRGRVVGTIRVTYSDGPEQPFQLEPYFAQAPGAPPREQVVESSKVCTEPSWRGGDLFYVLVRLAALATIQAGRRYMLMSCADELLGLYSRLGFRQLGVRFTHPKVGVQAHLLLGDIPDLVAGRGINPVVWNVAAGYELWRFAQRAGLVPGGPARELRMLGLRLFKPLAPLLLWLMRRRGR